MNPSSLGHATASDSNVSITERTLNRIDSALAYLTETIGQTEETFGGVLRSIPPTPMQDKGVGGEIKEVSQSLLHGSLVAILDKIEAQQARLASINGRSTL